MLKILGDAGKSPSPIVAAGFYFGAAVFITLSFVLQWRTNGAYFRSQADSRTTWLQTLYNYISTRERNEIADTPIAGAMKNYHETRTILLLIYVLLVILLVGFGSYTLRQISVTAPSTFPLISNPATSPKPVIPTENPIPPVCVPSPKVPCPKGAP